MGGANGNCCRHSDVEFEDEVEVLAYKEKLPAADLQVHGRQFEQNLGSHIQLPLTANSLYSGNLSLSPQNAALAGATPQNAGYYSLPPTASAGLMPAGPAYGYNSLPPTMALPTTSSNLPVAKPGMTGPLRGIALPPV
mmetsp:Transcript_64039/g.111580  ORF Transcript_64039/g.111580 Transcript_64039/m.111580 type:complete len:138 (+) Transcript_64039:122-535(+)